MNKLNIYKAVSDLISDNYAWLSSEAKRSTAVQYILGMNDMARYLMANYLIEQMEVNGNGEDLDGSDHR